MTEDYHAHTEMERSSISGVENPANVADQFVTKMINGKPVRVKVHTPAKNTGQRQSYLQRDKGLRYTIKDILDAARRFDYKDSVIAFSNTDSDDLRDRHTGPKNYFSAVVLNTLMDQWDFMAWRMDQDFNMFSRNKAITSLQALLDHVGIPLKVDNDEHPRVEYAA